MGLGLNFNNILVSGFNESPFRGVSHGHLSLVSTYNLFVGTEKYQAYDQPDNKHLPPEKLPDGLFHD